MIRGAQVTRCMPISQPRLAAKPQTLLTKPSVADYYRLNSSRAVPTQQPRRRLVCTINASSAAAASPAPDSGKPASLSELPAYPKDFVTRRLITFVSIVLGYSCFYLTRNSLTYTAPVMVADKTLGFTITDVRIFKFISHV